MKIDRVLLAWDGNPRYAGLFEMHRKIWAKLGIEVSLAFVSDGKNGAMIPHDGHVVVLEDRSTVPFSPPPQRNWKATMAIIHGPRLFPGEVVMVTGMDQLPASRRFLDTVAPVPDDQLISNYGNIGHIPTGNIVAHHDTWSKIMTPAPMDFTELIEWTWAQGLDVSGYAEGSIGWGNDEVLFTQLAQQCGVTVHTALANCWPDWLDRVLGITQVTPDPEKLRTGWYSELHVRMPLSARDHATFKALLELDPFL